MQGCDHILPIIKSVKRANQSHFFYSISLLIDLLKYCTPPLENNQKVCHMMELISRG